MKQKRWVTTSVVLTSLVLASCGNKEQADETASSKGGEVEQVFKTVVPTEMPTMDVSLNSDVVSATATNSVYEGLYRFNGEGKAEPAGASEVAEVSQDGLVYTFKLREEAKWSDGQPLTAKDYVYSWQRGANPDTGSEYGFLFTALKNGEAVLAGDKPVTELGVQAISDHELEVTLEQPTPYFDYLVAFSTFFPQRQDIVEKYGKDYAATSENAVYNGPYVLTDFDGPGTDIDWNYEKNPEYWDKETVKLDRIEVMVAKESSTALNLYKDGQTEDIILTGELAQQMADDPDFVSDKKASTMYLEMNQKDKDSPFNNEDFRKAISYAIDRESLVTQILGDGSIVPTGLVPAGIKINIDGKEQEFAKDSGNHVAYNPEKAKDHWEKAQKELGKEVEFSILTSDTDSAKKVSEYLQGTFKETLPGVKVNVNPVTFAIRIGRGLKTDFEMLNSGWNADYADPSTFIDLFETGVSYNLGKYSNAEYDKLVKQASVEHANDPEKRWQDMLAAEKLILDQAAVIPLYQKAEAHLRSPNVKDVVVNAAGAPYDYKWAYKVK
ncbi:peptide ABC transporter substrate-binding protein [Vagococcus sp. BWB3-3]|uniref:Peptide ABC transporter substrate-binding protein n=1 Tax=Vagococcus allomyrinae TaxID=2794353 RepID=A0A940SWX6_9ENTE|nr:peptide ABC transporter substrate-binding protein [Vagococcus allomyrinae]